ncbi:hypothetical protein [Streptomyces sp. NPDC047928]|uniref:hypothetical protein n=1 Tax=unclassified Streptomyces TaxID=2593676 RepID=UPI0037212BF1
MRAKAKRSTRWRLQGLGAAVLTLAGLSVLVWPTANATEPAAAPAPKTAATTPTTVCVADRSAPDREWTVQVTAATAELLYRWTLSYPGPCASYGKPSALGDGSVRTYAQLSGDRPQTVGIVFPRATLRNLPTAMTDGKHCYDMNGDGKVDEHTECVGGHERPLDLPPKLAGLAGKPLTWALVNYNPMGHGPEHIYDSPHFDFHFYIQPKAERDAIRTGPCGLAIDCDDYATATKPVPPQYMPQGYRDNGVAEAAMGNHLIDDSSPEWHNQAFTHTFIYGSYDAKITFLEPMISKAWFDGLARGDNPSGCFPIKQPRQWQVDGWYPQEYCIRYRANRDDFTVSMENFKHSSTT